jgi:aldehyde dehydrogenase (NAD+)
MAITNTTAVQITKIVNSQREYFATGQTLNISYRIAALKSLKAAIKKFEKPLAAALWQDLHKSYEEAYLTELSIVLGEIDNHIRHLKQWAAPKHHSTPLKMFPSRSKVISEPLGLALIIAPWNYPVQLLLNPLVGAISAGCTAILKPSPYVPTVAKVLEELITECFNRDYVAIVQGNRDVNTALLEQRYDIIFFTGSPSLGRTVMAAAAKNLTPVILELGGKSPCIIDKTADIPLAARRIAWGKTLNSGQTCIAPDYILINKDVKEAFVQEFAKQVHLLHGEDVSADKHYVRMVNQKAFERVTGYLKDGKILFGGSSDAATRYIEPTLVDVTDTTLPIMNEEIFGPVFPVITIDDNGKMYCKECPDQVKGTSFRETVTEFVTKREKPLAFYYFGKESDGWDIVGKTSSGGGCINDVIMHIANENVPFGGVGNSGMGRYHSRDSFEAFSHTRSIIATGTWIDLPFRYMPYKMFGLVKKIL